MGLRRGGGREGHKKREKEGRRRKGDSINKKGN
jgi:hypothetical protein